MKNYIPKAELRQFTARLILKGWRVFKKLDEKTTIYVLGKAALVVGKTNNMRIKANKNVCLEEGYTYTKIIAGTK